MRIAVRPLNLAAHLNIIIHQEVKPVCRVYKAFKVLLVLVQETWVILILKHYRVPPILKILTIEFISVIVKR